MGILQRSKIQPRFVVLAWLLVLPVGLFWAFGGADALDQGNYAWMQGVDPKQHLLGWLFFRETPFLQFPLGLNPAFGEEMSSSVVFSDSIPLLALIFKYIGPVLPGDFQYFGLWILGCFVLQTVFAYAVLRRLGCGLAMSAFGAGLLLASPIMLFRLHAHEALVGHWTILAAILIYLQDRYRPVAWSVLLIAVLGVHAYLTAMVGLIWAADLVQRFRGLRDTAIRIAVVSAVVFLAAWSYGYFSVGGNKVATGGFGLYRTTLQSWVDPVGQDGYAAWSRVLPDIPNDEGAYEGFAYIGLGGLLMMAIAFSSAAVRALSGAIKGRGPSLRRPVPWRLVPLILAAAGSAVFALAGRFGGFGTMFVDMNLPDDLPLFGTFRASGRFIWFPTYLLLIWAIVSLAKGPGRPIAVAVVALSLAVQLWDLRPAMAVLRKQYATAEGEMFPSPFWASAESQYSRLALWPAQEDNPAALRAGFLAKRHGWSINVAHLARYDVSAAAAAANRLDREVFDGRWRSDTLYLITDGSLADYLHAWKDDNAVTPFVMGEVDGVVVVAPRWDGCREACGMHEMTSPRPRSATLPGSGVMDFSRDGNSAPFRKFGWSDGEGGGRWTVGSAALLSFARPAAAGDGLVVHIRATPFLAPGLDAQEITTFVNGRRVAKSLLDGPRLETPLEIDVPGRLLTGSDTVDVLFRISDPTDPASAGVSDDIRALGLFVRTIKVSE